MSTYKEVKRKHERAVAQDFANHISSSSEKFFVVETPDPPDAILKSNKDRFVWIEISDIFRSAEEARDVYSDAVNGNSASTRSPGVIFEPDIKISLSTIQRVEKKIDKASYETALHQYNKGILVLWIYDPLFSESTLTKIMENFEGQEISSKFFEEVYIYWPDTFCRVFQKILGQND